MVPRQQLYNTLAVLTPPAVPAAAARKGLKNRLSRLWKGAAGETGPAQVRQHQHASSLFLSPCCALLEGFVAHLGWWCLLPRSPRLIGTPPPFRLMPSLPKQLVWVSRSRVLTLKPHSNPEP